MIDPIRKNNVSVLGSSNSSSAIIFAHGFGTDQTSWKDVYPHFTDDYKVVLYDNVGGGKSDPAAFSPNRYDNLHSYADDLLAICDTLEISEAIMIGHSVSGMISLLASIKQPERFKKLILVGASARYLNDDGYAGGFSQDDLNGLFQAMANNYYAWVSGFAPAAMANEDNPDLAESFAQTLSAIRPDIAQSVARVIFQSDYRNELHKCSTPTLLIQTQRDIAVTMEAAEYLHDNIPDSELVVVNAEGHFPHISAPQEIVKAIQNYI